MTAADVLPAQCTVSVVSHGHDAWLPGLLQQLAADEGRHIAHVIVTHNLPPMAPMSPLTGQKFPFRMTELRNATPSGFGANHNRAFEQIDSPLFCVLNPDISLPDAALWAQLEQAAHRPGTGCAFPVLLNPDRTVQDNARATPTPLALWRRRVLQHADARVDWASAAFWVLPAEVFRSLGGFDERYFLYCEDTEFCLRMQLRGWTLVQVPAHAVHHAQRSSHRRWRHLVWHVESLLRLWTSRTLWHYLRRQPVHHAESG